MIWCRAEMARVLTASACAIKVGRAAHPPFMTRARGTAAHSGLFTLSEARTGAIRCHSQQIGLVMIQVPWKYIVVVITSIPAVRGRWTQAPSSAVHGMRSSRAAVTGSPHERS